MGGTRHEIFLILPLATLRASQSENFALIEVYPYLILRELSAATSWMQFQMFLALTGALEEGILCVWSSSKVAQAKKYKQRSSSEEEA